MVGDKESEEVGLKWMEKRVKIVSDDNNNPQHYKQEDRQ